MSWNAIVLLLVPAVLGLLAGFGAGGRLSGLARLRPKALWLLWVGVAVQFGQRFVPGLLVATYALVLTWLAANLRHRSRVLRVAGVVIALGVLLNGLAILANGRMPYSPQAAAAAGVSMTETTAKGEPADDRTRLAVIADTVPVPALRAVASPGDGLIAIGIALALAGAMYSARRLEAKEVNP